MFEQTQKSSGLVTELEQDYWQQKLSGSLPIIELPSDRPRQASAGDNYAFHSFQLESETIELLKQFTVNQDVSIGNILCATFLILLYRYTNLEDLALASYSLGGDSPQTNPTILRANLAEDLRFNDLVNQVQKLVSEASSYNNELLASAIKQLLPEQGFDHFKVWFEFQTETEWQKSSRQELFDLGLVIVKQETSFLINFQYSCDLYDASTIVRIAKHWQMLVCQCLTEPQKSVSKFTMLTVEERERLLTEWNQTQVEYPTDRLIHQQFEVQVEQNPDAIAVVFEDEKITYAQLNQRANQLAHYLQSLGVKPEVLVGICIERSVEMVVGLLAILKAGGAYVPFDPHYPEDRLSYMLNDSGIKVLLSQKSLASTLAPHQAQVFCLDSDWQQVTKYSQANLNIDIGTENLAYVIYTSGSTGKPKGVMNTHRGIHNRLCWMQEAYGLNGSDRVLQKTPFSFDVSVWEFFWTLMMGATMVVAKPEGHKDSNYLIDLITKQQITTMHFVPSMLQVFLQEPKVSQCSSLKRVFCSGEALPFELTKRFFDRLQCQLHNLYGPTEATIDVTFWQCQPEDNLQVVPIGRPIANTQTYILDQHLQPLPIGVLGELHLGGVNLARGYLNRPELTDEKFIANPLTNEISPRLYKTGDLARYRHDGNIEYMGRIDHQVKLRGFRIELGEIEAVLDTHPQVQQAVVLATEDPTGNKRLVAYLATDEKPKVSQLRDFLAAKLPEYMVPGIFITLDTIPLTPNGKVDRRALPAPDIRQEMEKFYQAPTTDQEQLITDIWQAVLNLEKIGIDDNFFELGGNSLLAMEIVSQMMSQISVIDLSLNSLFEYPTIKELVKVINFQGQADSEVIETIQPYPRNSVLPLSSPEKSLWFFEQLYPQSCVYNIPLTFQINGEVKIDILEQSLNQIVQRHEIFRTSFSEINGQPSKIIASDLCLKLSIIDSDTKTHAQQIAHQEAHQPFNLEQDFLFRAKLVCLSKDRYWLLITCHHIVFDGWSIQVLFNELTSYYNALRNNQEVSLPELGIQYVDYAHWQNQWLQSDLYTKELDYWRSQLAGAPPLMELPTDRARPIVQSYKGDLVEFQLSEDLTNSLNSLSRQEEVTLYMTLLAAFKTLLYRYTGQSDMLIGSPFANRIAVGTENLIGFFVNTLVLRTNLADELNFQDLLSQVREITLRAYAHANLPFDKLVEELQPKRDLSYNPFFQVMFALQKKQVATKVDSSVTWEIASPGNRDCSMFDLTLDLEENTTGIKGHFEYNTDLFDRETIMRMVDHWQNLLAAIVANPQTPIAHLPLLTNGERQTLIDWNQSSKFESQPMGMIQLFEAQVDKNPDAVAIVFGESQLTYKELNQKANQLAHFLKSLGVGTEILVGICVERSLEMIIGLLGILKAGGAYVPLDPAYPYERLAYMVQDANISVLLTQTKWQDQLPESKAQVIYLDADWTQICTCSDENLELESTGDPLAYVIYTSGSTGKPKGVMITHRSLSYFTRTVIQAYNIKPSDRLLQFASINFDVAVEEIFPSLCGGAALIVRSAAMVADVKTFFRACEDLKLTILNLPTAYWHQLTAELGTKNVSLPESLKLVIIGGEAVLSEPVKFWQEYVNKSGKQDRLKLINSYGPTETTVSATMYLVPTDTFSIIGEVPIGRPMAHLQTYILDRNQQLVPIGVPGELYIGGDALARGYLNRPKLTQERFIPIPNTVSQLNMESGERLYRTGDLAKYLPDGEIEYLGRIDNQVKIRGFRIELGEIESMLTQHSQIKEVAVSVSEDSTHNKRLIAYIIPSAKSLQSQEVRSFLQERLPSYMVPSGFVFLDVMPLMPNGKLDRRALPIPEFSREADDDLVLPTNDVEVKLAKIWSEILNINTISIEDNFFELGGHSLLAVKLMGEIESQFDRKLPLTILFEAPSIKKLGNMLQVPQETTSFDSLVTLKKGNSSTPLFLIHDADGETILYLNLARHLKPEQTVYGLRPPSPKNSTEPILHTRISEIAAYYIKEIRKVQSQGPYLVGGLCAGGVLAFEIACQLQGQGEQVPLVAIIDAMNTQGISHDGYTQVNQNRKQNFLKAFDREGQTNSLISLTSVFKTAFIKVSNLISYEVSTRSKKLADNLQIKILRYCLDRQFSIPEFCQNIPLRSIYSYAEDDPNREELSIFQGQLTLWRATEKLDLDNPAIDDTPAICEVKDPLLGWEKNATQGVAAHDIPGGHSSMLQEPNVQTMAKKLQSYIDSVLES